MGENFVMGEQSLNGCRTRSIATSVSMHKPVASRPHDRNYFVNYMFILNSKALSMRFANNW